MARAVWSGAITFGLVNIPIKVYGATEEKDLRFTTLHATCKTPLKRPYMCPVCNTPVESKDMIKGYEYGKGNYVLLDDEEMDAVQVETSKAVSVLGFVDVDEIGPLFYEKSYFLGPEETSVKPFELLRQALVRTDKVAIAQATLWKKEHLVALRPIGNGLVLTVLFYENEVKGPPEIPMTRPIVIADEELELATKLISELTMEFGPAKYKDRYREALLNMIEAKVAGKEVEVPPKVEVAPTQDLMAALRASLEAMKKA
jgi:DNA end-binding protein Ku